MQNHIEIQNSTYGNKFSSWYLWYYTLLSVILVIVLELYWTVSGKNSDVQNCDSHPKMKFYSKGINLISLYLIFFSSSALFSFLAFFHSLFFFLPINLNVFELYSTYCVFFASSSHHIDNEIIKYIIKSIFYLWLFIIDWSKHSISFLRYFIEFHQTIILNVLNEIIRWQFSKWL